MFSYDNNPNQERLEHYEYIEACMQNEIRTQKQSFSSIYDEIKENMSARFGNGVITTNFNPMNSSVYHITVLFDVDAQVPTNAQHEITTIAMSLNHTKLGYLKGSGRNDYEKPYQKTMINRDIPLPVVPEYKEKERYSPLRKPRSAYARVDAFKEGEPIPFLLHASRKIFRKRREYWQRVDDLQTARKKLSYLARKEGPKNQTVFVCDDEGGFDGTIALQSEIQTTLDESNNYMTAKFIKKPRNPHKRSIRNDIIYMTKKGFLIDEVKPSVENSDSKIKLLYKQLMAYDAEQKYYNNYNTPMVLGIPVLPTIKQLNMLEKVKKDSGRQIGVLCVADKSRFVRESLNGVNKMKKLAGTKQKEEFMKEADLIYKYYDKFV